MDAEMQQMNQIAAAGYGRKLLAWETDEYPNHGRTKFWYIVGAIISVLFIVYAVATANFMFAVIILMIGIITLISTFQEPDKIDVMLTTTGVIVGNTFYGYQSVKDFSIIYEPKDGVKVVYLDFVSPWQPLISIPLEHVDPNRVREILLTFCIENLRRSEETLTEMIRRVYKL